MINKKEIINLNFALTAFKFMFCTAEFAVGSFKMVEQDKGKFKQTED